MGNGNHIGGQHEDSALLIQAALVWTRLDAFIEMRANFFNHELYNITERRLENTHKCHLEIDQLGTMSGRNREKMYIEVEKARRKTQCPLYSP